MRNLNFLIFLSFLASCNMSRTLVSNSNYEKDSLYRAMDFTTPGLFTKGIEGPATDFHGTIYAVNFEKQGTVGMITPQGIASLYVTLPEGSVGNGIRFTSSGEMLIADYKKHNILIVNPMDKSIRIFAHDDKMNQPNDLAISKTGFLYCSDPKWADSTGNIWMITPTGEVHLLEQNMGTTNGIEVSADEKKLYVNESISRKVWVYDRLENGKIANKRLFIQFPDFGMDGMRSDEAGNIYITRFGKGTVAKVSPSGKILCEIVLKGKNVTNICFGGKDGKTCYVTLSDRGCMETFRVEKAGREFKLKSK